MSSSEGAESQVCYICNIWEFDGHCDFYFHHLCHIRDPKVSLHRLNARVFARLKHQSYKLNKGVARRSVSPLKISLKTVQGKKTFFVNSGVASKTNPRVKDVEGNNGFLERLGAGISIRRRGSKSEASAPKIKQETSELSDAKSPVSPPEKKDEDSNGGNKEKLLEKLSGIGGISIGKKAKDEGGSVDNKPPGLSIASKSITIDINAYRDKLKEKLTGTKGAETPGNLLAKLSGISGISFAPKGGGAVKTESETDKKPEEAPGGKDNESTSGEEEATDESDEEEEAGKTKELPATPPFPPMKPETLEPKVRVSTNLFAIKEETGAGEVKVKPMSELVGNFEATEEKPPIIDAQIDIKENVMDESAINILERLTEKLNEGQLNNVPKSEALPVAPQGAIDDDDDDIIMEEEIPNSKRSLTNMVVLPKVQPPSPTPSEQLHPDFLAPVQEAPPAMTGQVFQTEGLGNGPEQQAMLQQQAMSDYTDVSCLESYSASQIQSEQPIVNGGDKGLQPNGVDYAAMQTAVSGPPPLEGASYWTNVGNSQPGIDQPQQDPLMTADGQVAGSDAMNQAFLQNFLNEQQQQAVQHAIPNDGAEFVSLDRLGQSVPQQHMPQQQSQPFDQQQMMSPPGMSPQNLQPGIQPSTLQGALQQGMQPVMQGNLQPGMQGTLQNLQPGMQGNMQPGMQGNMQPGMQGNMPPGMPQLYPGFNVFNQQFAQQQQPPMLQPRPQARPQITPRSFQSMAALPRPRAPRFGVKRPMVRLPSPQEMTPPKQRKLPLRMPSPSASNVSPQNRSPGGSQMTPPKKTAEANKVANVLASRGITVTSSTNRQPTSPKSINPALLNLSSQISVTPSSQNRNSGGFAVPGNRRSVVNNNVDRPDRCTTVDLTLDDEPPQRGNRIQLGRFPCNMCTKVFTSTVALETHKSSHRAAGTLAYKCDKCSAQYPSLQGLNHHKITYHKNRPAAPDLAIPVVDINHPGAKEQLQRCGFTNFIPLPQLQSNSSGVYGIPILNLETAKEKVVSNLNALGASNIFVLGKLKPLSGYSNR